MPYFNEHLVIGHVGSEPEVKYTTSGKAVANFSVATTEKWKDKDGNQQERTEWHRIVVWDKGAEFVEQYVSKGDLVMVKAPSRTRKWQDNNDVDRYTTEIVCTRYEHFALLKKKVEQQQDKPKSPPPVEQDFDDDIPF
jgi:single-strand DNA-binding protein